MPKPSLPVWAEVDVLVLGGGPAGFAAAVSAARLGCDTLLVERHGFLGGMATAALVMPWNVWAKPVTSKDIGGVYSELLDVLGKNDGIYTFSERTVLKSFDASIVKISMDSMCHEAGVRSLVGTLAVDVYAEGPELRGVVLQNKCGRGLVLAKVMIDSTGDGDVGALAGGEFKVGNDKGSRQPGTLIFKMAGVDVPALVDYLRNNPGEVGNWPPTEEMRFSDGEHVCLSGCPGLVAQARRDGFELFTDQIILCNTPVKGVLTVNMTRVYDIDLDDPFGMSNAEIEARRQILLAVDFLKRRVPGFTSAHLSDLAVQMGVRETRRLTGDHVIAFDDVMAGKQYSNRVAKLFNVGHLDFTKMDADGKRVATFEYLQHALEIPLDSLLVKGVENLLSAGRCISTDAQVFGFVRTQTACFASGQAAGTAAALSVKKAESLRTLDVDDIQEQLTQDGIEI